MSVGRNCGVSRVYRCVIRTIRGQWRIPASVPSGTQEAREVA
jgi:hypothetical protein